MLSFLNVEQFGRATPRLPAILAPDRPPLTYSDLSERVKLVTAALDSVGLSRGDAVALVSPNGPEFLLTLLGASALGACAPLDPGLTELDYRRLLVRLRAPAVVIVGDQNPTRAAVAEELGLRVVHIRYRQDYGFAPLEVGPSAGTEWAPRRVEAALLLFTSSTTGEPKLVPLTVANLYAACSSEARISQLDAADRLLNLIPMSNLRGVRAAMTQLHVGGSVVCPPQFDATQFPEWLVQFRPTWITIAAAALNVLRSKSSQLPGMWRNAPVRFIMSGGTAANGRLLGELEAVTGIPILEGYGTTEACGITRTTVTGRKPGSVGKSAGVEIAILNESGSSLGACETGEVAVRGPSVMSGYVADDDAGEDANRRIFSDGWLLTADLGHLDADGFLFLTGRKNDVINRGGQKVSPQSVEAVLKDHAGVEEALVFGIPHRTLGTEIAAGVVLSSTPVSELELRRFAAARLPQWQVPRRVVFLETLPRNASGKPSRRVLAESFAKFSSAEPSPDAALTTETERTLAGIWREWLAPNISSESEFYRLGGDSLMAVVIATGIKTAFGVDIDLRAFAEYPKLHQLAAHLDKVRAGGPLQSIEPTPRDGNFPLSFAQERVWSYTFANPAPVGYCPASHNIGHVHLLRGPLDVDVLRQAVEYLVDRHEVLRTVFAISSGVPVQEVLATGACEIPLLDFSQESDPKMGAMAALLREVSKPLPLAHPPLMRLLLARLDPETHWLFRINVHLISDGQSWQIFFRELGRVYQDLLFGRQLHLPDLPPVSYADFVLWQRQEFSSRQQVPRETLQWWTERIEGARSETPAPFHDVVNAALPRWRKVFRRSPARTMGSSDGLIWWGVDAEVSTRLNRLQAEEGATYYQVRLAAFAAFVAHLRGVSHLVIGSPGTFRNRVEWQHVMGDFANFMTVILALDPAASFRDTVRSIVKQVTDIATHTRLPCEFLGSALRERGAVLPDVDVSFYANDHTAPVRAGDLEIRSITRVMPSMPWAFSMFMDKHNEDSLCLAMFDANKYERAAVQWSITRFRRLLDRASRTPDARLT